jgi:alkylhydroperoxidase family enzyme
VCSSDLHTFIGKNLLKLDDAELQANRDASSSDAKARAAVRFAAQVVQARGHVGDAELAAVKAAGFTQAQVLEIVLHTVLNTLTNYVNTVAKTDIDFPVVTRKAA